jgi:deoxycytidine triphosphate deaminase
LINTALLTTVRDSRIPSLPCLPSLFCPRWIPKTLYSSWDPFPEIAPALLNSADISDYVRVTGMIYPFYKEKLKSASYPVAILGKLIYWDDEEKECQMDLQKGDYFTLKSNSIAFVTLEPMFRIPNYIALRFNFKITNVYRGILLGTGPLVDPGFVGKLSIPLHNLTSNDYLFKGGEDLIWMEFTKLSGNHEWDKKIPKNDISTNYREGKYSAFPSDKTADNLPDVLAYLRKAEPHRPIRSSIPQVFQAAKQAAEKAKESVESFQKLITIGGSISALVIFLVIVQGDKI